MIRFRRLAFCIAVMFSAATAVAQPAKSADADAKPAKKPDAKAKKPAEPKPDEWLAPMDYGPFLMTSVARTGKPYKNEPFQVPGGPKFTIDPIPDMVAVKGIVIPLGPKDAKGKPAATVVFDTEKLSMAAGWTGGWLDITGSMLTNHKGTSLITLEGKQRFGTSGVGVAAGTDAPLPGRDQEVPNPEKQFLGHYVNGDHVILSYKVHGTQVLEVSNYDADNGVLTRTIQIIEPSGGVAIAIADATDAIQILDGEKATIGVGADAIHVTLGMERGRSELVLSGRRLWLSAHGAVGNTVTATIAMRLGGDAGAAAVAGQSPDLRTLTTGGPSRWKPITTTGKLGDAPGASRSKAADPAFVADDLTVPFKNDYNSWFRFGGFDFFSDGRAAVCTLNGDVWIVSGIDAKLDKLTWTRFATGLYMPLGLCIVKDQVYVRGRDQITRLHDKNADGEADFYENFSPEGETHPSYHGLVFDLQTDAAGNFYYARGGIGMRPDLEGHGKMIQLSPDGKTAKAIASGLRAPNGLGVVRGKWITVGDNQGHWIPTSRISLVDPKGPNPFLGFLPHHHQESLPTEPAPPLVWIPHALDNSSGGQCEIPAGTWGDFGGQWLHSSFGAASVMLLLPDAVTPDGQMPKQAAVARIPLDFATGVMRPRFNPKDGQLYVVGVGGGWQTKGTADAGFYRIRHTGKASHLPTKFAVVPGGVQLSFAVPLEKEDAADPDNYAVEQWNYKWSEKYGSPDFSAINPDKAGHDEVKIEKVTVSEDGKTVTLKLEKLMPVNQMKIECRLITADDKDLDATVYATINAVP